MSYLVLARKYRPSDFFSVSGQEHVTRTLANAIRRDRVVHAYLFTGPRGVGKTSVSRILSKALNCVKGPTPEPCLECANCKEITQGSSLAVREIDGASHNSVDNVRELMDSFKGLPPPGYRYKVYIIDEVHMLSISAFNALLKSLEEPPPNTVFILATTEIHKIPDTVISRCQRHDFRALSVDTIEARLRQVVTAEGLDADAEAIRMIARLADGSMRDAQTLLDRVQSFCAGTITAAETSLALGTVERAALFSLSGAIFQRDVQAVLGQVGEIFSTGIDPTTLLREFVNFWRELFVARMGGDTGLRALGVGDDAAVELKRLVSGVEAVDIQDLWDVARDGADRCLRSAHPRHGFEALVVRMATRQPVFELGRLVGEVLVSNGVRDDSGGASRSSAGTAPMARPSASSMRTAPQQQEPRKATIIAPQSGATPLANPASAPVSNGTLARAVGAQPLAWAEFLSATAEKAGMVLAENMKRIRVTRFEVGILEGTGPEFTVSSIIREREKVLDLLSTFVSARGLEPEKGWKLSLVKGPGATDGVEAQAVKSAPEPAELQDHPAIQSLQKVFPGSKVEGVRVKNK